MQKLKPQTQSRKEQALDILRKDLILFGKKISPRSFYLETPPVHREIESIFLDESLKQANIIAPRGIAKSTLVVMYVLHHLFLGPPGRKVVVIISKTQAHAKSLLATIKNILDFSHGFRKLFDYHGEQVAKVWREERIVLDTGDALIARGTGQPIRGVNESLQRPTLIVVDDPEDENNTKTVEAMAMNIAWILKGVVPSRDSKRGRIIIIGTPLHERCIVMSLSEMKDWKTIHLGNDLELGIALWPEQESLESLTAKRDALKDVGKVQMYYQEYECKLIPGEDALFKKEDIQYYDEGTYLSYIGDDAYLKFSDGNMIAVNVYMGVDPASSVQRTADYSTIVPVAITHSSDIFVLDYFRKRVTPLDLANAIEDYFNRYHPRLTTIESTGYQEMLRQYMRTRIFIPGLELKERPRDSKSNRLEMLQPFFAQKKVFLKESMTALYDELTLFPKSKHDDLLDALYYACKRIRSAVHSLEPPKLEVPEYQKFLIEYFDKEEENEWSFPSYVDLEE